MRKNGLLSGLGRFRSSIRIWSLLIAAIGILQATPCSAANADDITSSAERSGALVTTSKPDDALRVRVSDAYGKLYFEANRGQTHAAVKFLARSTGHTLFLAPTEAVLVFTKLEQPGKGEGRDLKARPEKLRKATQTVLRMTFLGVNPDARVAGRDELPGRANYFIGNDPTKWRTNVPTYAKVRYENLYPGIDLIYYGNHRQLEYDFVVRPGADPGGIALSFLGADKVEVDTHGDLVLHTAAGALRQRKPVIYQEIDGTRREIAGGYVLQGPRQIGFRVAAYDASRPLIIDPVLFFSTYLGGSGSEGGEEGVAAITVDSAGNAYVTGGTDSLNFPTISGSFQTSFKGVRDAFVTKLDPSGSMLVYSTYLGGSDADGGLGITVDASGNAYVTGITSSTDFPTTSGVFQSTFAGVRDAFVTKLDPSGSMLVYSTYLGGGGEDDGFGVAVDPSGSAYVTGETQSCNFPTTAGAFQPNGIGVNCFTFGFADIFVTKLNPTGTGLVYSTYLGDRACCSGIAIDAAGNAYVAGTTQSTTWPTTTGAFQTSFGGASDAFVTKLNPTGTALVYSTYLGGSDRDGAFLYGIAIDAAGNAYVAGQTLSSDFPTTPGAFQTALRGVADGFVTKLNPLGTGLVYSTYLGGSGNDDAFGIAVDSLGNAYVAGFTTSTDFPTVNAIQSSFGGGSGDAFVTKVNPLGTGLVYSTYLGGTGGDVGSSIALDTLPRPNAYVTGVTSSTNFPTTTGAFQTTYGGGAFDAFVAKIANIVLPPGTTKGKVTGGGTVDVSGGIANFGFIVQAQSTTGQVSGDLQYVNHASSAKVHSVMFDTLVISGNMATFGGACTNNGAPCTFTVNVTDNGEPGTNDHFTITVDAGPPEGDKLRSGNILIHQ